MRCISICNYNYNIQVLPIAIKPQLKKIDKIMIVNKINSMYSKLLEREINKYPHQYFWFHRKFDKKIYKNDL